MRRIVFFIFLLAWIGAACVPSTATGTPPVPALPPPTVTPTPFQPTVYQVSPTAAAAAPPAATSPATLPPPTETAALRPRLWLDPSLPPSLREQAAALDADLVTDADAADVRLILTDEPADLRWVYALVAPFATLTDALSAAQVLAWWRGDWQPGNLYVSDSAAAGWTQLWGMPGPSVQALPDDEAVLSAVRSGAGWGLVGFENLSPRVKVIQIADDSPLHNDFHAEAWPLTLNYAFRPPAPALAEALSATNRDAEHLTVLVMTGVTALVRATADRMEKKGVLYPGGDIRDWLRGADLTHISNEVPFFDRCPQPNPMQDNLIFCSSPDYIALLEDIGTDVVELTGNHFQDYGSEATLQTLDMYDARGWPYYGGGRDAADAMQPAILEDHGNRLAFLGCNPVGPDFAWARENRPGAAPCGDYAWMTASVQALKAQGYFVIATFQYQEYYVMSPPANQVRDFERMAAAGADIVSGSQSHFPQGMAFSEGAFIHYGLGNLFFDQMDIPVVGTRRAFIDRYAIYENRLIGVELLTTMLEDYARPRPMTPVERQSLLRDAFAASGWTIYP